MDSIRRSILLHIKQNVNPKKSYRLGEVCPIPNTDTCYRIIFRILCDSREEIPMPKKPVSIYKGKALNNLEISDIISIVRNAG